jgi:hypothetical protein
VGDDRRGLRPTWRQLTLAIWSGKWELEDPWHCHPRQRRLGRLLSPRDPPGLSPSATVGRFGTGEAAMVATDEM